MEILIIKLSHRAISQWPLKRDRFKVGVFSVIRGQPVLLYFQSFTRRFDRAEYAPRIAINQINAGDRRIPSYNRVYCFQNFKTVVKGKQLTEFLDFKLAYPNRF